MGLIKKKKRKTSSHTMRYHTNQSCMPPLAKQQIDQIIESGAAQPLVDYVNKTFQKKPMQQGMLREYLWQACQIFQPILKLQEMRRRQDEYLEALTRDLNKLEQRKSKDPSFQDLIEILRLKKIVACQHSNFVHRSGKDLSKYALSFFLNLFFSFLNTEVRKKLIANLFIFSGLSSAVCFEVKGKKSLRQFFPSIFCGGGIKIVGKKISRSKSALHTQCPDFPGNADTLVSADLLCGDKFCFREASAFVQRRKRAERLFSKLLNSENYHKYMNDRLAAFKRGQMEQKNHLGPKAIAQFRLFVKGEYLMPEFLKLMARLNSFATIYLDDLALILRENKIRGLYIRDCYRNLVRDREFRNAFNVIFSPLEKSKA